MKTVCQKCGRPLRPGQLKYQVKIELTCVYDGVIEEPEGVVEEEIERLLEALSRQDPRQTFHDVAQVIHLLLCPECRTALVAEYRDDRPGEPVH